MTKYHQPAFTFPASDRHVDKIQQHNQIESAVADSTKPSNRNYSTVKLFEKAYPSFTEPALRNLIFKSEPRISINGIVPGNGLIECGAIVRIGRKVLINEEKFFVWIESQQKTGVQ